jgi:sulfoxide reductase heme-binding subunit YedZ
MAVSQQSLLLQRRKFSMRALLKPAVFLACLMPLLLAVYAVAQNRLGANPVESLLHLTGIWGLRLLLITLAVTPLQFMFRWTWVAKLRRMLGLFAFFYACLHMLIWLVLDMGLQWHRVWREIVEKQFIAVGFIALFGLLLLALTSNRFSIRRLGRRWKSLHKLVYPLTLLAIVHFLWQVKANNVFEPLMYLGALLLLLGWRFYKLLKS